MLLDSGPSQSTESVLARLRQAEANSEFFQERLSELELELADKGWRRSGFDLDREFSRSALNDIIRTSRLFFLKNPLINRAVTLQAMYVWGQGVEITSKDESVQKLIDAFTRDPLNQAEMFGHQARMLKEQDLTCIGSIFFVYFSGPGGRVSLRTLPTEEIEEIITNPDDVRDVWFYRRTHVRKTLNFQTGLTGSSQETVYYPDWRYTYFDRPEFIGGKPVAWDSPVYQIRTGCLSDMLFGVPETYQALDWARAYRGFLEDWATIVKAYSRFAFNAKTPGGAAGTAAVKARLGTTVTTSDPVERNPPPVTGSTIITGPGADLTPIRTAGATTSAEDGRRLLLMVCAAFGMPESFFGDVSVGTLATAKSLDRPTELKFRDRQQFWADVLRNICWYAVSQARPGVDIDSIEVKFPPILEHDIESTIGAIAKAATLDGKQPAGTMDWRTTARLVLAALEVPNQDEVIAALEEERAEAEDAAEENDSARSVAEAVRQLREAIAAFHGKLTESLGARQEQQPVINVTSPPVNVSSPVYVDAKGRRTIRKRVERDERGLITGVVEESEDAPESGGK